MIVYNSSDTSPIVILRTCIVLETNIDQAVFLGQTDLKVDIVIQIEIVIQIYK